MMLEALAEQERRDNVREWSRRVRMLRLSIHQSIQAISDVAFRAHYRLTKPLFWELCHELRPFLPAQQRSSIIPYECKILAALSFYATGSYQKPIGMSFMHGLSQPAVSRSIRAVTDALNEVEVFRQFVHFPATRDERMQIVTGFYNKFGMPGVLGCVDGTHVALVRPKDHEERFFNRKHYHSRNIQIVCDSDLNILDIDPSFGGATHDAFIWRGSHINNIMQDLHRNEEGVWLLGDSGYPLRPWLMTPIINAVPGSAEEHYTGVHCTTRNCIERCIGVLKSRWRCLLAHRVLHYDHIVVGKIVNACAVLHNIANKARLEVPVLPPEDLIQEALLEVPQDIPHEHINSDLERGQIQRQMLVNRLVSEFLEY